MNVIRILQISDILAGAAEVNAGDIFDELTSWVNVNSPGDRLDVVDYIVVCGNITADGKPESFEVARKLLRKWGEQLLVKDSPPGERWRKETRFNRMMVVPGRTDIPGLAVKEKTPDSEKTDCADLVPDFQAFKKFHDELFADELDGRVSPFELGRAMYRPMKDVTLIGGSYWDVENGGLRQKLLEIFKGHITDAKGQLSQYEYLRHSPRILITAGYPLFNWDVKDIYRDIRRFLRDELSISLHLFGSGSVVGVLPEPYSLPHIGLGTGPRSLKGFWPFRANLIKMVVRTREGVQPEPLISNYVFHRLPDETKFSRRDHIKGQLDSFLGRQDDEAPAKPVFDAFLKRIESAIFRDEKSFILISGLPGSGKSDLFKLLREQSQLGNHDVKIVDIELDNYNRDILKQKLAKAEAELVSPSQSSDNNGAITLEKKRDIIVVVRDLYFGTLGNRKSEQVADFLDEEIVDGLFMVKDGFPRVKAIVYLISGSEPDIRLDPQIAPHRIETIQLCSLAIDAIQLLVKQYSRDAPVIEFDLDNVTGGYAGFSKLLLDATKEAFDYVTGAEPISSATSARLMQEALDSSKKLKDEAQLYLQVIESRHAGAAVSQHIQNEIRRIQKEQRKGEPRKQGLKPPEVSVSVRKLKRTIKNPTERRGVQNTLDQFVSMGVLEKDRNDDDIYKVRVVVPFLIASKQRPVVSPVPIPEPTPADEMPKVDFLIVTALKEERDAVLKLLPGAVRLDATEDSYTYYSAKVPVQSQQGTRGSYNVIVMSFLGMGRVRASIVTANAIQRWRPRCVLLVGIAGGVEKQNVQLGDILIAKQIIDYELQKLREDSDEVRTQVYQTDEKLRQASDSLTGAEWKPFLPKNRPVEGVPRLVVGDIATGDKVDARAEIVAKIGANWPNLIGIEMEAGGAVVAALHAAYNPRFFMIRCVSDLADKDKDAPKEGNWWEYACDAAAAYALALLKSGPLPLSANVEVSGATASQSDQARREPRLARPSGAKMKQLLSPEDMSCLADLLVHSGKAERDVRPGLCAHINLDPDKLYFIELPKNIDFAIQLVTWLQETGNAKSLLGLCDVLGKLLQGGLIEQLDEIRGKLEEPIAAR